MEKNVIHCGDSLAMLKTLPDESVDCVVTSPPYWALRDYGVAGQLGLEPMFQEYITKLCDIFDEVKRVLKKDGTCWVNIGDTYSGSSQTGGTNSIPGKGKTNPHSQAKAITELQDKSLCQIPSRFAIEMSNRGWILRNEIIWHKPNAMPSSVKDRFTVDFEKVFFFVKSKRYYFETQREQFSESSTDKTYKAVNSTQGVYAVSNGRNRAGGNQELGRNKRTVWSVNTKPFKEAHFATYPEALIEPMIKAGCPIGGTVLDIFFGAGTTGVVAIKQNKNYIGIELNPEYIKIANERLSSIPRPLI